MMVSTLRHTTRDRADIYDNDGDHEVEEDEEVEEAEDQNVVDDHFPHGEGEGQGLHLAARTSVSLSVDPSPLLGSRGEARVHEIDHLGPMENPRDPIDRRCRPDASCFLPRLHARVRHSSHLHRTRQHTLHSVGS